MNQGITPGRIGEIMGQQQKLHGGDCTGGHIAEAIDREKKEAGMLEATDEAIEALTGHLSELIDISLDFAGAETDECCGDAFESGETANEGAEEFELDLSLDDAQSLLSLVDSVDAAGQVRLELYDREGHASVDVNLPVGAEATEPSTAERSCKFAEAAWVYLTAFVIGDCLTIRGTVHWTHNYEGAE